jgi:hypothetical protein
VAAFTVTLQAPVPVHAPDQPLNTEPASASTLKLTTVPVAKLLAQVAPQEMPDGEDVTVPEPVPARETASVNNEAVVEVKVPDTPPTVSVVETEVFCAAAEVWRTQTDWPEAIVPTAEVNTAPQPIEYSPPVTEIALAELMPPIVTLLEVTSVEVATPDCAVKEKPSGTVSATTVKAYAATLETRGENPLTDACVLPSNPPTT